MSVHPRWVWYTIMSRQLLAIVPTQKTSSGHAKSWQGGSDNFAQCLLPSYECAHCFLNCINLPLHTCLFASMGASTSKSATKTSHLALPSLDSIRNIRLINPLQMGVFKRSDELWESSPALIVIVRRMGCALCRVSLAIATFQP